MSYNNGNNGYNNMYNLARRAGESSYLRHNTSNTDNTSNMGNMGNMDNMNNMNNGNMGYNMGRQYGAARKNNKYNDDDDDDMTSDDWDEEDNMNGGYGVPGQGQGRHLSQQHREAISRGQRESARSRNRSSGRSSGRSRSSGRTQRGGYGVPGQGEGRHLSEEHKQSISESLMGNENRLGTTQSPETRRKISEALRGNTNAAGTGPYQRGGANDDDYNNSRNRSRSNSQDGRLHHDEEWNRHIAESLRGNQNARGTGPYQRAGYGVPGQGMGNENAAGPHRSHTPGRAINEGNQNARGTGPYQQGNQRGGEDDGRLHHDREWNEHISEGRRGKGLGNQNARGTGPYQQGTSKSRSNDEYKYRKYKLKYLNLRDNYM